MTCRLSRDGLKGRMRGYRGDGTRGITRMMLTEMQIVRRKFLLKGQAIKLLQEERNDLKKRLWLFELRDFYERLMMKQFDPALSAKLDAIIFLLEM